MTKFLSTTPDDQALALKMYSGHFVEAFRNQPFLYEDQSGVIFRKFVDSGKSWQSLDFADISDAEEFTPGNEMSDQGFSVAETTITVDGYVKVSQKIPRDQMKISHFEVLPKLARSHKRKIGMIIDGRLFRCAALAARSAAVTKDGRTVHSGGNRVTRTGGSLASAYPLSATGAANFRADLRKLAFQMDEDNIPRDRGCRKLWVPPYMLQVMLYDTTATLFSRDYINGENNANMRQVTTVEGFELVSNNVNYTSAGGSIPDQNFNTGASKYQGNFTAQASDGIPAAIALVAGPGGEAAVGLVTFEQVINVVKYFEERLEWLVMSFCLCGAGQLNPYCAGSVEVIT